MTEAIVVHTEADYAAAQQRAEDLSAKDDPGNQDELAVLAEAMLAYEMRRDDSAR